MVLSVIRAAEGWTVGSIIGGTVLAAVVIVGVWELISVRVRR
ncbi:MAG: hypothetical protein OEM40_10055 [Acidimicrobiia bacterium]|nr:hypothetical protein [Acidimicrobiia bacterium]